MLDICCVTPLPSAGKKPTDTYLESTKRGKECCVFLINGQRQDAWDDTFIERDLGLKYLRHRTLIVVDLDGLKNEATLAAPTRKSPTLAADLLVRNMSDDGGSGSCRLPHCQAQSGEEELAVL